MTAFSDLRSFLTVAARDGRPARQGAATGSAEETLRAIMARVDMTVLPRRLAFRIGETEIGCTAANRRLTALDGPIDMPALGPEDAEAVARTLRSAIGTGAGTMVTSGPGPKAAAPGHTGLLPSSVLAAAGLPEAEDTSWADSVAADTENAVAAIRVCDQAVTMLSGEDEDAERLTAWAAEALDLLLSDACALAPSLETEGRLTLDFAGQRVTVTGHCGRFDVALTRRDDA